MLFDILAGMGEIIVGVAETLGEAVVNIFSQENNSDESNNETYEYWSNLSYQEQEYYFNNNEYLKDYIKNDYYPNNKELTAKHVADIADRLGRNFTDKYSRY